MTEASRRPESVIAMTLQILLLLIAAFAVFIIVPIALVMSAIEHFRHKASERKSGGGGISGFVGGAMLEMDKFVRPSAEHHIAAEKQTLKREDDTGGE
jgi:cobalamin synthase